jgi:hypothetical protein
MPLTQGKGMGQPQQEGEELKHAGDVSAEQPQAGDGRRKGVGPGGTTQ